MSSEVAVVSGLGILCAMFGWFAFNLRDSGQQNGNPEDQQLTSGIGDKLSILFFIVSVLFANLLMYALLLISQNSITYLEAPVMSIGLSILTYGTIAVLIIWLVYMVISFIVGMNAWVREAMGKRGRNG